MSNKLTENYIIPCYDTDASWRLKPVSFMNYAQEMANRHATILGFGYDLSEFDLWLLLQRKEMEKRENSPEAIAAKNAGKAFIEKLKAEQ